MDIDQLHQKNLVNLGIAQRAYDNQTPEDYADAGDEERAPDATGLTSTLFLDIETGRVEEIS